MRVPGDDFSFFFLSALFSVVLSNFVFMFGVCVCDYFSWVFLLFNVFKYFFILKIDCFDKLCIKYCGLTPIFLFLLIGK